MLQDLSECLVIINWLFHTPKTCSLDGAGDLDLAEKWLRRMKSEGEVKPNVT